MKTDEGGLSASAFLKQLTTQAGGEKQKIQPEMLIEDQAILGGGELKHKDQPISKAGDCAMS